MNFLTLLITFGLLYQNAIGGIYLAPYQPFKNQHTPKVATHVLPDVQFNSNTKYYDRPRSSLDHTNDGNPEVVGFPGLLHVHAAAARARARATTARIRTRARLHYPHRLRQETPPDEVVSMTPPDSHLHPTDMKKQFEREFPKPFDHSARSADYEEDSYADDEVESPKFFIQNIDNSEEVYQNRKPGFSIIPTNWKPPPESNLYLQGDYQPQDGQEPILAVLPGKWTHDNGYRTYYYNNYEVIPTTFNIPDGNTYGRSSNHQEEEEEEGDDSKSQRAADARHFHRPHTFIHQHIHNHGNAFPSHSGFEHQDHAQSSFSHEQTSSFSAHPASTQHSAFFKPGGHQITINKQHTTVLVPDNNKQNVQIAQVAGNNNGVSQSQAASHGGFGNNFFPPGNQNFQSAQVTGSNNAVSQSQTSTQAPFVSRQAENVLGAPNIINFPHRNRFWRAHVEDTQKPMKKRSIENNHLDDDLNTDISKMLLQQKSLLKDIRTSAKADEELLFITDWGSNFLDDLSKDSHAIKKRSARLLSLIVNPNAKMDVPKTLDNVGTVLRNSLENERTPGYHVKNFVGAAKDAFFSTLKMAPHDLFVPSKYKIVERDADDLERQSFEQKLRAVNPSLIANVQNFPVQHPESLNYDDTYARVGSLLRETVQSGRNTLAHVGDMYHSARNALATARHSAPRVVLSTLRIPAVQKRPLFSLSDKIVITSPKIIQTKSETVGKPRYSDHMDNYVGAGNILNSLGISNPDARDLEIRKIVLHPSHLVETKPNFNDDDGLEDSDSLPDEDVKETLDALYNAKNAVGAKTLKDFVLQMKNGFSSLFRNTLAQAKGDKISKKVESKKATMEEKKSKVMATIKTKETDEKDAVLGAGLPLSKRLLTPFMGRPSKIERRKFFEEYGDSVESSEEAATDDPPNKAEATNNTIGEKEEITGAINPMLFDREFELCDGESPFAFLVGKNSSSKADNETDEEGETKKPKHKCSHVRSTTMKSTETTEISLAEVITQTATEENTKFQEIIEETSLKPTFETTTQVDDAVTSGTVGISMKMGKKLLTPFMGKLQRKEETVFDDYNNDGYEDFYDDGYLAAPEEDSGETGMRYERNVDENII